MKKTFILFNESLTLELNQLLETKKGLILLYKRINALGLAKSTTDSDKAAVNFELNLLKNKKIETDSQIVLIRTSIKEYKKQQLKSTKLSISEKINLIKKTNCLANFIHHLDGLVLLRTYGKLKKIGISALFLHDCFLVEAFMRGKLRMLISNRFWKLS